MAAQDAPLFDATIERALAAALVVTPGLFALGDRIGFASEMVGDLQARAVLRAVVNLHARGAWVGRPEVLAEIGREHADTSWYEPLLDKVKLAPPKELVEEWMRSIVSQHLRRNATIEEEEAALRAAEELDDLAMRDLEREVPSAPGTVVAMPPPKVAAKPERPPLWRTGPQLVDEIWSRKDEPWVCLSLGGEELARVRSGGIAVVIGGSGSGKSSLVSGLLLEHARQVGPAIAVSIELPSDELGARVAGMQLDASWEDVLCGRVKRDFIADALNVPRLYVLDRKSATLSNLVACVAAARAAHPGEPILAAIDYAQLLASEEKEARLRVSDAFERIDDVARGQRIVAIAVSQMGRAQARQARDGERIGADSSDLGAESSAIERFASVTLSIGRSNEPREDGSREVELSIGKSRMGNGDRVVPMNYWGRSGRWRVAGEAKAAAQVRAERKEKLADGKLEAASLAMVAFASKACLPVSRDELHRSTAGRKAVAVAALERLLRDGELVEVRQKPAHSRYWLIWTRDRAVEADLPLVAFTPTESGSK